MATHSSVLAWEIPVDRVAWQATVHGVKELVTAKHIGKGGRQGCILSPCLFNLYAEYIMRNAGLEEASKGLSSQSYGSSSSHVWM